MNSIRRVGKTNDELDELITRLKSGEHDGADIMMCWIALRELQDWRSQKVSIDGLRELCGYVEDGSSTSVRISQDDATKTWVVDVGKTTIAYDQNFYHAISKAIEGK